MMPQPIRSQRHGPRRRAFTLIEALVVLAIVSVLLTIVLPGLSHARNTARSAACLSNLRSLGVAWHLYADDHDDAPLPAARPANESPEPVYWWGRADFETRTIDPTPGPLDGYFGSPPSESGALECAAQPFGSYVSQPVGFGKPTSTYGYNGYAFTPILTGYTSLRSLPRWRHTLPRHRVRRPAEVLVFADAMIRFGDDLHNTHLLDPPELFGRRGWTPNHSPTTSFRHGGSAALATNAVRADGSARSHTTDPASIPDKDFHLGSLGTEALRWYVPDADRWTR